MKSESTLRNRKPMAGGVLLCAVAIAAFVLGRASGQETMKPQILSLSSLLGKNPPAKDEAYKIIPAVQGQDASVNVVRAEKDLPPHYHESREEIVYVVSGGGTMRIGDATRPVKAGDLVYIPRHVVHGFSNGAKRDTVVVSVMTPPFDGKDRIFVGPAGAGNP